VRDAELDQLPVELRGFILQVLEGRPRPLERGALLLELTQRFLLRQALPLKRGLGLNESGPLLLKLAFRLLACDSLPLELLLRRDDHGGLVGQAGPQLLGLLGPLLGLTLLGPRSLVGCAVTLELGASRDHLRLPLGRHGVRPRKILPRPPQCLVSVHERSAHRLDGGGSLHRPALLLQELVLQGFHPIRQPPVLRPQGLDEGVESVALLLESAELGAHPVKGVIPSPGAVLQFLPPTNEDR
jgi:hypothetical protein